MRVISRRAIREFVSHHADAATALYRWANVVESTSWEGPAAVRESFHSADFVGNLVVFNIAGNKYRLIAFLHYSRKAAYIKHILTHSEYDKGAWKS